ncbi:recombination mediator RecR [Saprospiraceae bacterium]|nr:recombination mediator RecR [Saprospiraceae bacterium]HCV50308.1 recombination protein RecR [Saprospirales bacterium]MDA9333222.1 recombination mediator RecR [Saprospiraceae bacterium]MDA9866559.1 recombination mediator RecR [Saprospiraceae bacterium]MDB4162400.1 recombination mediator RecR [Saprospiraceae bacterium]
MNLSSKLLQDTVNALSSLPSIGKKSALRLALHLIDDETNKAKKIANVLGILKEQIKYCVHCHNISDLDECEICINPVRNRKVLCIVESIRDVIAIEETQEFSGLYHVLGGVISPMDGIGPDQLNIDQLVQRVKEQEIDELIMALSPTIEGETTIYYITKLIDLDKLKVTTIARGVAFGGELEYADEVTLGRSIRSRLPYSVGH